MAIIFFETIYGYHEMLAKGPYHCETILGCSAIMQPPFIYQYILLSNQ